LIDNGVDTTFFSVMAKPYVMLAWIANMDCQHGLPTWIAGMDCQHGLPAWIDSRVRSLFN